MKIETVYFKSENDAESAKSDLEKLNISNVRIEEIPKDSLNKLAFSPLFSGFTGVGLDAAPLKEDEAFKGKRTDFTHLLHFKVPEEEYKQAMSVLENRSCYKIETK